MEQFQSPLLMCNFIFLSYHKMLYKQQLAKYMGAGSNKRKQDGFLRTEHELWLDSIRGQSKHEPIK